MPASFSTPPVEGEHPDKWWRTFDDPELNVLAARALAGNFDLRMAWARLRQARALAVQVGAALFPNLTVEGSTDQGRRRTETDAGASTGSVEDYALGLVAAYEVDLWGRVRSERTAARLDASASLADLRAAGMTIAAEVARRWVRIISERVQKRLLEEQLETNRTFLELVELRFEKGMVSALDVYQQRQIVEGVRSRIPMAEAREQLLRHELALLLGKPPAWRPTITRRSLPVPKGIPATGLPADLLMLRPDVRAAALRLESADWAVSAARADRLPALRLTGTARYSAADLDRIFDNWLLNLAAGLTAPVLDGGRRAAAVDAAAARADERLWDYRRTVYTAIKEVEDALVSETKRREHIQALEAQRDAASNGLERANQRYRNGVSDYLPVLTQLLTLQGLERDLVVQRTELLLDRIRLHRALGGTWVNDRFSL
jgi:NodT family efflux transporter outer membrane factor (OMF) lipoprotein